MGKVNVNESDPGGFANQTWKLIEFGNSYDYYCQVNQSNWMSAVPDDTLISELSIPGTHDTCALIDHPLGFARCQNRDLREQLYSGIRFIDIRVKRTMEGLKVYHGHGKFIGLINKEVDQKIHFR